MCSREEGEDAHQHAFLAVYQAIGERDLAPRAFKPWLYTIARNHCFSVLRSRREVRFPGDDETVAAVAETAERAEQQAEVRELLTDVRALPEPQRVALLLS
ncbi:MAG: sigma-70 family RNA polymerase sigma factor, partial [Actinobacteria bacterium]|nr:sigma-70 family RNA polymerase sigma factor [Actinomycetota bacterium]